jgi:probable O-glycosylation ligase (exosortase A-associated)
MLRSLFVIIIILVLTRFALKGPFGALVFYLWLAYFRPEVWLHDPTIIYTLNLHFTVGVYLILRAFPKFFELRLDLRMFMLMAFLLLSFASAWTTDAPAFLAWDKWIEFLKSILVAYLLFAYASTDIGRFRIVLLVIAFSLGFEAAKQGYTSLIRAPGATNLNALPQLGDNNGVAVGILMLAATFSGLSKTATGWMFGRFAKRDPKGKWERRLHQFFVFGTFYRAITTYSRGAFLAAGAMGFVNILRSKQKFKAIFGAAVVAGITYFVLPQAFWDRMSTIQTTTDDPGEARASGDAMSSQSRIHFWRVAMDMAAANPVLGVGYNAYNYYYNEYDFSRGFYGRGRSVHSMWFGIIAELGYTGILLFAGMFIFAQLGMFQVARLAKKGRVPMEFHHYAVSLQSALTACMIGGAFVPFQYTEMLWHFIAITMALRTLALKTADAPAVTVTPAKTADDHIVTGWQPPRRAAAMRREPTRA